MPQAPMLPPDEMAKAQASAGINPASFLMAAADLHNSGQLSMPQGPSEDPLRSAFTKQKSKKNLRIIK